MKIGDEHYEWEITFYLFEKPIELIRHVKTCNIAKESIVGITNDANGNIVMYYWALILQSV